MNSKKIPLIILFCFISYFSHAQDYTTAIGLRLGNPWAFSYKTFIDERNAIEGVLGFHGSTGYSWVSVGGFYEHHTPIVTAPGLSWYYGGGAAIYFSSYDDDYYGESDSDISFGISGIIGLDYKIKDTPLNISLDWTPTFFIGNGSDFDAGYGSIGVRYILK